MQDLGPDMEDLLRRASEQYPLKPGPDRWDEIAGKLSPNQKEPVNKNNGNQWGKFMLFLLLALPAYLVLRDTKTVFKNELITSNKIIPTQQPASKVAADAEPISIPEKTSSTPLTTNNHQPVVSNFFKKQDEAVLKQGFAAGTMAAQKMVDQQSFTAPGSNNDLLQNSFTNVHPGNNHERSINEQTINPLAIADMDPGEQESTTEAEPATTQISGQPVLNPNRDIAKKSFYYGFTAGIGLNAIKDQGFHKAGFKAGLLAGYRITPALSIETGLSFSKKNYQTEGRYFNMDEMHKSHPDITKIMELHGSTNLFELPVLLRYDFVRSGNHRFFTTAGLSTYLMTLETNDYNVMMNGTAQQMTGTYKKDKLYYTASFDIGFGFEKDFGKKTHLRLEPYLQVPLSGMGMGLLPVTTTGIKIGISRSAQ